MKAVSAIILLFFAVILGLALYDAPDVVERMEEKESVAEPVKTEPVPTRPLSVAEKKKRFVEKTLPAILRVKAELDEKYQRVLKLSQQAILSEADQAFIETLKQRYKVEGIPCLLNRLKTHPTSIILAQAALETGWGTSRFYNEANNIFGIWSYNKNEPRIAASETRGEKTIYVKKYATLDDSIRGYFKMMSTGRAYADFRKLRKTEANPFKLIATLTHYSELREEYVKRLYHVIKSNRFYLYDQQPHQPIPLAKIIPEYVAKQQALREAQAKKEAETSEAALVIAHPVEENATTSDCNTTVVASTPASDT